MTARLDWDEAKRRATLRERGLDFTDLAEFDLAEAVIAEDRRRDYGERRFIAYGRLKDIPICIAFTPRAGRIRIISMRKANARERRAHGL